jgi:hypothetical protein
MKKDYDLNVKKNEYTPEDYAYIQDTVTRKERNKKLNPRWKGAGQTPHIVTLNVQNTFPSIQPVVCSF